ncbi:MAG: hypothetical protein ACTHJR_11630 [Sphingomonas sp.]|uniref:hypothetical protein n=1 Tax=Sphingomonas sp. TaxID=28214 RepID=UPI003F7D8F66
MMGIPLPSFLSGQLWKIATGAAGVIALVLGFMLISTTIENHQLSNRNKDLMTQIEDPNTGYVAKLAQAHTNVATLQNQLKESLASYQKLEKESNAKLADTEIKLKAAQDQTEQMKGQLRRFLATKPQGSTLEAQINDIDRRAMAEFLK